MIQVKNLSKEFKLSKKKRKEMGDEFKNVKIFKVDISNSKKLKKSSTHKVNIGKKKFQDSGFGDKLKKFKNSKTFSEVIKD